MHNLDLNLLITYNPHSIDPQALASEAMQIFERMGFHHLPVVNRSQQLAGVLSYFDLWKHRDDPQCKVSEVMSREPITVSMTSSPLAALRTMLAHGIHSAPVVDQNQLVGLITSTDFLREFSYGGISPGGERVSSYMTPAPDPIEISSTLEQALAVFENSDNEEFLPLAEGELTLAIISRRDVLKLAHRQQKDPSLGLRTLFNQAPGLSPGERMAVAAESMVEHHRLAAGVVNRLGRLLGIVTADSILRAAFDQALLAV